MECMGCEATCLRYTSCTYMKNVRQETYPLALNMPDVNFRKPFEQRFRQTVKATAGGRRLIDLMPIGHPNFLQTTIRQARIESYRGVPEKVLRALTFGHIREILGVRFVGRFPDSADDLLNIDFISLRIGRTSIVLICINGEVIDHRTLAAPAAKSTFTELGLRDLASA
jgi:hypothetical protein